MTAIAFGLAARFITLLPGPAAIVIGNGLALSSTAVVLQVEFTFSSLGLADANMFKHLPVYHAFIA